MPQSYINYVSKIRLGEVTVEVPVTCQNDK